MELLDTKKELEPSWLRIRMQLKKSTLNLVFKIALVLGTLLFESCQQEDRLFTVRKGPELGIDFQNTITTNDTLNALTFEYIYNGSGVGVGDFNNDGLEDLVFGGNQVSSRLYINKGDLRFKDVTELAKLTTTSWITGVSVVDINEDGLDDIYFCVAGKTSPENRRNLLPRKWKSFRRK